MKRGRPRTLAGQRKKVQILRLHEQGDGCKKIARTVGVSHQYVRKVLRARAFDVALPVLGRAAPGTTRKG